MIHDKLCALRRRAGLSQQEVARTIGVSRQTISNWELGQGSPALDKAAELCRLYGVTLDDLVNEEVDIVVAKDDVSTRDLHVLRAFAGHTVTLDLSDEVMEGALVLDVSDGWLRVSCEEKTATFGSPKVGTRRVVRLIDLADVSGVAMVEGE